MRIRTTLTLSDELLWELERRAAARGQTFSALAEEILRRGLRAARAAELRPLPTHRMGRPRLDVADRDALERAMRRP